MSDEIPGPEVKGMIVVDDWVDESVLGAWHFATPEEVLALVRRGVESGTIEGEVVRGWWKWDMTAIPPQFRYSTRLVIPVPDGEETS